MWVRNLEVSTGVQGAFPEGREPSGVHRLSFLPSTRGPVMRPPLLLLLCVICSAVAWAQGEESRPAPVQGWVPAYDAHIRAEAAKVPALRTLSEERMSDFCPRWAELRPDARLQFYADLLYAISGPESGRDRRVMFNETGIIDRATRRRVVDSVTRRPLLSEGLLQLSYADMDGYPPAEGLGCRFDWEADRAAFARETER